MRRYQQKFIWQNLVYSNFTIILIGILIVVVSRGILNLYKKYQVTKLDYAYVSKEVVEAKEKMRINELKLENIKTEEGQEKFIRETYPVKKEGEKVVVVYNTPSSTYEIPKKGSNWEIIKVFFKNLFSKNKS